MTGSLADELVRVLKAMERTGASLAARGADGVDRAAYHVLFRLVQSGPQRSSALAEALLTDPSTISRHVAHLVEQGLVARTSDPHDGRATLLEATPEGLSRAALLRRRREAVVEAVVEQWSTEDREQLAGLLSRFTADLERRRAQVLERAEQVPPSRGDA